MTDHQDDKLDAREAWEQPELRRIEASDAEIVGASGSDGVIGSS